MMGCQHKHTIFMIISKSSTLEITIEKNAVFLKKLHFGLKFRPKMAHIQQIGLGGPNILKVRTFLAIYEMLAT